MKYLLKVFAILLVIFLSLKLVIHFFDKGHIKNYSIGNFTIKETLKVDKIDNYYFDIKHEDFNINFQIFKNYNKSEKIITDIKYLDSNYKCILPLFKGETLTDIMCLKDNLIMNYRDIKDRQVEQFAHEMEKFGYSKKEDKAEPKKISNTLELYSNNILQNHYLGIENYKGVTLINNEVKNIDIFKNDVYKKPISIFTDKYYVVADYDSEYSFKKFYAINLINGNLKEIRSYNEISFDSIIQGVVNDDIYIFDKDAENQYILNVEKETVTKEKAIKFYKGKWNKINVSEASKGNLFENYYSNEINGYDKVDKLGKKTGYYYIYKKQDNNYLVYRADVQNPKLTTYIFTTTDINSVIYLNDYIYFKNGTTIYYYSNDGVFKILDISELEFNEDIKYGAYRK